jgi:hypothetical protein
MLGGRRVGRKMIVAGRRMLQRAVTLVESRAEESPWSAVTGGPSAGFRPVSFDWLSSDFRAS